MPPVKGVNTSHRSSASAARKRSEGTTQNQSPIRGTGTHAVKEQSSQRGVNGNGRRVRFQDSGAPVKPRPNQTRATAPANRPTASTGMTASRPSGIPILISAAIKLRRQLKETRMSSPRAARLPLPKLEERSEGEVARMYQPFQRLRNRKRGRRVHPLTPPTEKAPPVRISNPVVTERPGLAQLSPTELDLLCARIWTMMVERHGTLPSPILPAIAKKQCTCGSPQAVDQPRNEVKSDEQVVQLGSPIWTVSAMTQCNPRGPQPNVQNDLPAFPSAPEMGIEEQREALPPAPMEEDVVGSSLKEEARVQLDEPVKVDTPSTPASDGHPAQAQLHEPVMVGTPPTPHDSLLPPMKCDDELRSRPRVEAHKECGRTRVEWNDLIDEFDRFIYSKTQVMKKDSSFIQSLSGLRQRWLKKKEVEDVPCWVTDALMDRATNRLKPTEVEVGIIRKLADPDTRFGLTTVNSALRGEVFTVDRRAVLEWGYAWASEVKLANWIPIWNTRKSLKLPVIPLSFVVLMWVWFLLFDPTCWYFVGGHWAPPTQVVWLPWWGAYYSDTPGPHLAAVYYDWRTVINTLIRLGWWYSVLLWFRRLVGCVLYLCKDYTRDGFSRTFHNGWTLFRAGNG